VELLYGYGCWTQQFALSVPILLLTLRMSKAEIRSTFYCILLFFGGGKGSWVFVTVLRLRTTGCGKKSRLRKFLAVFSATVSNFNLTFHTFIYRDFLHLTVK